MEFSEEGPLHKPIVRRHVIETDQDKVSNAFDLFRSLANHQLNKVDMHDKELRNQSSLVIKVKFTVE